MTYCKMMKWATFYKGEGNGSRNHDSIGEFEKNNPVWRIGEGVQNKSDFSCYPKQKKAVTNQVSVVK